MRSLKVSGNTELVIIILAPWLQTGFQNLEENFIRSERMIDGRSESRVKRERPMSQTHATVFEESLQNND